ncbi:MAG TPA: glycoside hydrolase family 3 protein [Candidatus Sulfomarinibacteraceae bacterium]|nr:glycoside hydrolase family 3 protein [Candidatus Sulfomarinibacteraceae bacterium]
MRRSPPACTRREFLQLAGAGITTLVLPPLWWSIGGPSGHLSETRLDVKIGQMILVGFRGLMLSHDNAIRTDLVQRYVGGVVLFDYDVATQNDRRNISEPSQLAALNQGLQDTTPVGPLLISVDQEGGRVNRLKAGRGFPPSYSQEYLGKLNNLALTRAHARTTARTLRSVGINLNLAPVVDLNLNPDNPIIGKYGRSFSADPDIVTAHAVETIKAHRDVGVLTSLKHFPGHGSARGDSHSGFVDVTGTWSKVELEPFRNIIRAGLCDTVMTAHLFNAHLDPNNPATLSYPTITGLLREEMGWDGVVISDDMGMGAITQHYGFETAIERAIRAGVDILAFANNGTLFDPTIPARAFWTIKQLVNRGAIEESRIDDSYRRILRLKARLAKGRRVGKAR